MSRRQVGVLIGLSVSVVVVLTYLVVLVAFTIGEAIREPPETRPTIAAGPPASIAFAAGHLDRQDIYLAKPDSSLLRLTQGMAVDGLWCSPDGRWIVFSERNERSDIYLIKTDGTGFVNLTGGVGDNRLASWSPDGTRLSFVSDRNGNEDIYVMNVDGSGVTRLTANPAKDVFPMWSPAGDSIVFCSERDANWEVYLFGLDGVGLTNVTSHPADDYWPIWSPDGRKIAFLSNRSGPASSLFVMSADASAVPNITRVEQFGDSVLNHDWSPNSEFLAYQQSLYSSETGPDIWLAAADGSQLTPLVHSRGSEAHPVWSPDGNWILFSSDQDGDDNLYVVRADSSEVRQITKDSLDQGDFGWCGE